MDEIKIEFLFFTESFQHPSGTQYLSGVFDNNTWVLSYKNHNYILTKNGAYNTVSSGDDIQPIKETLKRIQAGLDTPQNDLARTLSAIIYPSGV